MRISKISVELGRLSFDLGQDAQLQNARSPREVLSVTFFVCIDKNSDFHLAIIHSTRSHIMHHLTTICIVPPIPHFTEDGACFA